MTNSRGRADLLAAVVAADEAIWPNGSRATIEARDEAVHVAIAAGYSAEEIARGLHVRPSDVLGWDARRSA